MVYNIFVDFFKVYLLSTLLVDKVKHALGGTLFKSVLAGEKADGGLTSFWFFDLEGGAHIFFTDDLVRGEIEAARDGYVRSGSR